MGCLVRISVKAGCLPWSKGVEIVNLLLRGKARGQPRLLGGGRRLGQAVKGGCECPLSACSSLFRHPHSMVNRAAELGTAWQGSVNKATVTHTNFPCLSEKRHTSHRSFAKIDITV